jgi:brefeldin A-resistance guanine nucleotide exchange factor 1
MPDPYGVACVQKLFRFLISLCNPLDKQNSRPVIHMGLTLLTVALEIGADSIGKDSSLLTLVKDKLCRNLFSVSLRLLPGRHDVD